MLRAEAAVPPIILRSLIVGIAALICLAAASPADAAPRDAFRIKLVKRGFVQPTFVTHVPGTRRLLIVERRGTIRYLEGGRRGTWANMRSKVATGAGEQGLMSIAFHPDFAQNGRVFATWTNKAGNTRVGEMLATKSRARVGSMRVIYRASQPYDNHNGGQLQFGPDGLLYFGMGDGGSGGDPQNRAQNRRVPHGKMLRFDVSGARGRVKVPAGNPFRGAARRTTRYIWGQGLRNPWRFSFDAKSGTMYIGDVGQGSQEEIDVVRAGARLPRNFEWPVREGTKRFKGGSLSRYRSRPALTYSHAAGCSVTGGYVYRGSAIPRLRGYYLYADFCRSWLRGFKLRGSRAVNRFSRSGIARVSSFGEGPGNELYIASYNGSIYRLVAR